MDFKNRYTQDYYDAVDILVRGQYYDSYVCVLYDVSTTLQDMDENHAMTLIEELSLKDFDINELYQSDYMILEFDSHVDMEQYLFRIEHQNIFAKFFKKGELFEELPEEYE